MDPSAAARLAELDALRGVAVLLVLVFHYSTRFGQLFPAVSSGASFPLGAYGVHLFFLISGFVIVMTLDRSKRAVDFLVARFSRLYPAYWVGVLTTAAALWLFGGPQEVPAARQVAVNFTMLQGFFKVPSVDGVYWTLQVELLFYAGALVVFCVGWLERAHLVAAAWLAASALFLSPLWREHFAGLPYVGLVAQVLNLEFAPFFVIGMAFYRLYRDHSGRRWNYVLVAAALGLVLFTQPVAVTLLIAAGCGVFWAVAHGGWRALRMPWLVFLGTISYSLYLLHQKIGYGIMLELAERGWSWPAAATAAGLLCISLATLLTFLVERPAMKVIRRKYKLARGRPSREQFAAKRV